MRDAEAKDTVAGDVYPVYDHPHPPPISPSPYARSACLADHEALEWRRGTPVGDVWSVYDNSSPGPIIVDRVSDPPSLKLRRTNRTDQSDRSDRSVFVLCATTRIRPKQAHRHTRVARARRGTPVGDVWSVYDHSHPARYSPDIPSGFHVSNMGNISNRRATAGTRYRDALQRFAG